MYQINTNERLFQNIIFINKKKYKVLLTLVSPQKTLKGVGEVRLRIN